MMEMREMEERTIYKGYDRMASLASSAPEKQGKCWLLGMTANLGMPSGCRHRLAVCGGETAARRACARQGFIPSGAIGEGLRLRPPAC